MALTDYDPRQSANRAMSKARDSFRRFSDGFTPGQKAVTLAAIVGFVAVVAIFASVSGTPTYSPLFTNLTAQDAAAITAKLGASGVPYQLSDGGAAILVPAPDVNKERLAMAAAGLPSSGSGAGLSLLDKEGITTSNFTQQADYQRAIQDEIETTIDSIQGIEGTKVEIVLPSASAFALGNAQTPSASVLVDLSPGASLTSGEVQAIMHLTASAVPNLTPANVTVVDSAGTLLSATTAGAQATMSAANGYDASLEASLTSMLDQILGPGKAEVQVTATLSSATTKTTSHYLELNNAGAPVATPSSSNTTKTTYIGTGAVPGGVLGTNTVATGTGNSNYAKTTIDNSYATGEATTTTSQPPGAVSHLSVSVVVSALPKHTTLASLRAAVAAAAGIQPGRGDTLAVVSMPFSNSQAAQAAKAAKAAAAAKARAALDQLLKIAAVAVAILFALLVIWRRSRARREPAPVAALPEPPPMPLSTTSTAQLPAITVERPPDGTIEANPDEAARVLRSWLTESRESRVS
jgi:flagellar M-ring protein FliF